jgi:CRISPR-associated protein Cmr4
MFKKELVSMISFYAIAPVHAGNGSSTGAVDNPIQRERHTNWPVIQASAVKGAMRSHFRRFFGDDEDKKGEEKLINYIFGSDEQDDWDKNKDSIPGAISVSDAKLLAMPVRSNVAPFVWVTSPAVLKRLKSDLEFMGIYNLGEVPTVDSEKAIIIGDWDFNGRVILEDVVVDVGEKSNSEKLEQFFNDNFPEVDKLLLISDEMFKYVVDNCTEIQTQIKIDEGTGTTKDGSLRYEELLPSDTVLYSIVYFSKTANNRLKPDGVMENVKTFIKDFLQVGGDETLGRGICKIRWVE